MTWGRMNNSGSSSHLKALNLITPTKILCPGKVAYAEVPGLGRGHLGGLQRASPNMRKQGSSLPPFLPCSSIAPLLYQISGRSFGMMQPLFSWSCQSHSRGGTDVSTGVSWMHFIISGDPVCPGETRSNLSAVILGMRRC